MFIEISEVRFFNYNWFCDKCIVNCFFFDKLLYIGVRRFCLWNLYVCFGIYNI